MVSSLHWDEKQLRRRCSHSLAQSSKLGQALQLFTDMPCFGMNYFLKETAHWQIIVARKSMWSMEEQM